MTSPRFAIAGLIVLLLAAAVSSQSTLHSCLVVAEGNSAAQRWAGSAADCATRLSPASTYKIPHALIGLETGVITTATVEQWDGVRHPQQPKWNQDHTVLTSMKPSVLWFFQRMAPRIGAGRAHEWLQRFQYGTPTRPEPSRCIGSTISCRFPPTISSRSCGGSTRVTCRCRRLTSTR